MPDREMPKLGSTWVGRDRIEVVVTKITNVCPLRQDRFPCTVCFRDSLGDEFSIVLRDFYLGYHLKQNPVLNRLTIETFTKLIEELNTIHLHSVEDLNTVRDKLTDVVLDLADNLGHNIRSLRKLDREASKYVETSVVERTHFTGDVPYVGWRGLGKALNEALDERDLLRKSLNVVIPVLKRILRDLPPNELFLDRQAIFAALEAIQQPELMNIPDTFRYDTDRHLVMIHTAFIEYCSSLGYWEAINIYLSSLMLRPERLSMREVVGILKATNRVKDKVFSIREVLDYAISLLGADSPVLKGLVFTFHERRKSQR